MSVVCMQTVLKILGVDGDKHLAHPTNLHQHVQTILRKKLIKSKKFSPSMRADEKFCSHLTLGMTQNANESLHSTIWNLCPKAKYVSPQSVTISTAVAVTIFNEGELSIYGFMKDLQLKPTYLSFRSIIKREETKRK